MDKKYIDLMNYIGNLEDGINKVLGMIENKGRRW